MLRLNLALNCGTYSQFPYTIDVNGLFFEIVQRHQYGNYGEANAHVRIAAQVTARLKKQSSETQ